MQIPGCPQQRGQFIFRPNGGYRARLAARRARQDGAPCTLGGPPPRDNRARGFISEPRAGRALALSWVRRRSQAPCTPNATVRARARSPTRPHDPTPSSAGGRTPCAPPAPLPRRRLRLPVCRRGGTRCPRARTTRRPNTRTSARWVRLRDSIAAIRRLVTCHTHACVTCMVWSSVIHARSSSCS